MIFFEEEDDMSRLTLYNDKNNEENNDENKDKNSDKNNNENNDENNDNINNDNIDTYENKDESEIQYF